LLGGPEHIGKMSLIKDLISQVRTGKDLVEDSSLGRQLQVGQGPGLLCFWDGGESLKIEEVRRILDFVAHRTEEGEYSFCVIEHMERMTHSAANALLKVLEEPSERCIFLMTTREEKKLLPTLRSRVQFFRCTLPAEKELSQALKNLVANELEREELVRLSAGRIGLAIAMNRDKELLERMQKLYDDACLIFEQDIVDRFALAERMGNKEYSDSDRNQFLAYLARLMRHRGLEKYQHQLDRVQEVKHLLSDTQVNKRLFLEHLFLQI
ncbi:MAG: hypothetical protein Q8P95_00110, partial [bacterium]|nr:hypothetical protein [bacterium]